MSDRANRRLWSDFWGSKSDLTGSGCLPNALPEIDAVVTALWLPERTAGRCIIAVVEVLRAAGLEFDRLARFPSGRRAIRSPG